MNPYDVCASNACGKRQGKCGGRCLCLADDKGEDIQVKAAARSCPLGLHVLGSDDIPRPALRGPAPAPPQPIPISQWPLAARVIHKLRSPEDKGIGSTIARVIDPAGGVLLKRLYKRIVGKDCGCGDRAARLDAMFRYD